MAYGPNDHVLYLCYSLPGNTVVETRRMVLVKIEPQPVILRSYDMVMAHYHRLLDSKLDSSFGRSLRT